MLIHTVKKNIILYSHVTQCMISHSLAFVCTDLVCHIHSLPCHPYLTSGKVVLDSLKPTKYIQYNSLSNLHLCWGVTILLLINLKGYGLDACLVATVYKTIKE